MPGIQAPANRTDFLALSKNLTKSTSVFVPNFIKVSVQQSTRANLPLEPLSLNEKLPFPFRLSSLTKLTRNKLGNALGKTIEDADFDLTDPYLYKAKLNYEPLHDPALRNHLHGTVVLPQLQKMGFVSQNGDVLCSMKEFCNYMRYLDELYSEQTRKVKKITDEAIQNRRKLRIALKTSQRYNEYLQGRQRYFEARQQRKEELLLAEKQRIRKYYKNIEKVNQALRRAHSLREQNVAYMQREAAAKDAFNKRRKANLNAKEILRKFVLSKLIDNKTQLAVQRKNLHQMEARNTKNLTECTLKNEHYKFRIKKNMETMNLIDTFQKKTEKGIQERIQQANERNEKLENDLMKRKANRKLKCYEEKSAEKIARLLTKSLKNLLDTEDEDENEHNSRLLNLLNKMNVFNSVKRSFDILDGLKIPNTTMNVIIETLTILRGIVYEDPQLELPKDRYVKEFIETQLLQILSEVKEGHLETVKKWDNKNVRRHTAIEDMSSSTSQEDPTDNSDEIPKFHDKTDNDALFKTAVEVEIQKIDLDADRYKTAHKISDEDDIKSRKEPHFTSSKTFLSDKINRLADETATDGGVKKSASGEDEIATVTEKPTKTKNKPDEPISTSSRISLGKKTIEEVLFEISNDAVNERFKTTTENTIQSEEKTIEALLFEISDDAVNERFKAATENIIQLEDKNEANKTITEDDKQSENELSFEPVTTSSKITLNKEKSQTELDDRRTKTATAIAAGDERAKTAIDEKQFQTVVDNEEFVTAISDTKYETTVENSHSKTVISVEPEKNKTEKSETGDDTLKSTVNVEDEKTIAEKRLKSSRSSRTSRISASDKKQRLSVKDKQYEELPELKVHALASLDSCFPKDPKPATINIDESATDIDESWYEVDNNPKIRRSVVKRRPTPTSSLHSMIDVEVIKFIEIVKKRTINVPEQMNIRNMIHLHDFQKRFIYTNLKRFRYYLKLKVEQDWNSTNDVQFFESYSAESQEEIITSTIDTILTFPKNHQTFTNNVFLLSKILCVEIFQEIN